MNDQMNTTNLPSYLRHGLVNEILPAIAMWDAEAALLLSGSTPTTDMDDNTFDYKEIN